MPDEFDPYLDWLGIPETARPPNYYQLLGVAEQEGDIGRIAAAADARMIEVRKYQTGPRGRYTQKILNDLSAARICLLDPRTKEAYDRALSHRPTAQSMIALHAPAHNAPPPEPPAAPPPKQSPAARPPASNTAAAEDSITPDGANAFPIAWLALGMFFVAVIIGAGGTVYVISQRPPRPSAQPVSGPRTVKPEAPPAETVLVITQEGNGDLNFPASTAELTEGLTRNDIGGESSVTGWQSDTAMARWRFRTVRPAVFQVRLVYRAQGTATAQWQLKVDDELKTRDLQAPAEAEGVVTDEFFWRVRRSGEQVFELSALSVPDDASVTLQSVRFIYQPGGRLQ